MQNNRRKVWKSAVAAMAAAVPHGKGLFIRGGIRVHTPAAGIAGNSLVEMDVIAYL
jgi:hypothetical protein